MDLFAWRSSGMLSAAWTSNGMISAGHGSTGMAYRFIPSHFEHWVYYCIEVMVSVHASRSKNNDVRISWNFTASTNLGIVIKRVD